MSFKISNETKVGALTAIAITLLILGFNFLKGRSYSGKTFLFAKFKTVDGLLVSNPVLINGFQVGTVVDINESDPYLNSILVEIKLVKDVRIPKSATAFIQTNPLGTPSLEIKFEADSTNSYVKSGDTLQTGKPTGLLSGITTKLDPVITQLGNTLESMSDLLKNVNTVFDPVIKDYIESIMANANKATENIVASTAQLNLLLNAQTGALGKSLDNMAVFTKTLAESKDEVTGIMKNVEKTTETLSKMELDKTIRQLNEAVAGFKDIVAKVNSTDGTLGSLINDKKIYNNLTSTVNSMNLLLQDLRLNPKRYVNISVFGKKDKSTPLMKPLSEDSITQEQHK